MDAYPPLPQQARFLLLVWAICLSNMFLFGLCLETLGQDPDALIRRDLKVAPERLAATSTSLQQLFRNAAHPHPAKPNAILIQIGTDSVSMEVQNNSSLLRFEGPARIVDEIAALGSVLGSNPRDTYRILSLNDNGQASLNQFSASASPKSLNGIEKIPSFLGLKQESTTKSGGETARIPIPFNLPRVSQPKIRPQRHHCVSTAIHRSTKGTRRMTERVDQLYPFLSSKGFRSRCFPNWMQSFFADAINSSTIFLKSSNV